MFDCIGVFKIPCMWPGRELWVAGGRHGGNEWDRTTPEDTEEQFQCRCRRIRPAATAAPILPRCILGNTKSVGFRVMQAIMRPPPSPSLSPSSSYLQLRSRSNRTFIHLSCGRSLGRPHPPPRVPDRANDVGAHAVSPRRAVDGDTTTLARFVSFLIVLALF